MSDLQQRLQNAYSRRGEILRDLQEQERQTAETPAARLAAVDAELEALAREAAAAAWERAKFDASAHEYDNRLARAQLVAALEALDFGQAIALAPAVDESAARQRKVIAAAITDYTEAGGFDPDAVGSPHDAPELKYKAHIAALCGQFTPAHDLQLVLTDFVYNGPPEGQHVRAGLAYAIAPVDFFSRRASFDPENMAGQRLRRHILSMAGLA